MGRHFAALALTLGLVAPAAAQVSQYEQQYGQIVEVSIDNILDMPENYTDKAVRTRGQLEMIPTGHGQTYGLRGTFGKYLYVFPRNEVAYEWEQGAKHWTGREIDFRRAPSEYSVPSG